MGRATARCSVVLVGIESTVPCGGLDGPEVRSDAPLNPGIRALGVPFLKHYLGSHYLFPF
jgi:hypothetical protein